jgi:protein-S-isoprenylcysteine O-methyltransferase Ste14
MRHRAAVLTLGAFFFRWRSYLPLLVLPMIWFAIVGSQHPFASHVDDLIWEAISVTVALLGQAIRVWTVGLAAPGTSGRNTRQQKAAVLNTTGPYSVVRHPLYVGNMLIALGLAMFPHTWIAPPLMALAAAGYYACIAAGEDEYLRERFGARFTAWAAGVPAFVPNPLLYVRAERAFDPRAVLRREFYGVALILIAPFLLDLLEDFLEEGRLTLDPVWTPTAVLGAAVFVVLRTLKKRSHRQRVDPKGRAC